MNKNLIVSLIFAVFLLSKGCSSSEIVEDRNPEHALIYQRLVDYYDDLSNRNWEAYADHFLDKAITGTVWQPTGEGPYELYLETAEAFIEMAPEGPGSQPIFEERMTDHKILQEGNVAMVWAHYDAQFGNEEQVEQWSGIDAFTLLKHDNHWKILSLGYGVAE